MAVMIRELKPPPEIREKEVKAAERVDRFIQQRNKKLSDVQRVKLEAHLKKQLKAAKKEYEPLRSRLSKYSDIIEGVVEETNFPFEGASNITLRGPAGYARTFKATFNKTVYSDDELFYPVLDPGAEEELKLDAATLLKLQEGFNHSFNIGSNGLAVLKSGTIPAWRDATFLIEGTWERNTQRVNDQRTYRKIDEFQKDYPEAKDAGLEEESYANIMDNFLVDPDFELVARFSYNHVMQDGIEYRQVLRAKFLVYPTAVKKLSQAMLYGCNFDLTKDEIKRRAKTGEFYEQATTRALARRGSPGLDSWDKHRLEIEGRSAPDLDSMPYRLADLVIRYDLDDDGYLETYSVKVIQEGDQAIVVACRPYDIRLNIPSIVPFRLVDRDYSFDGISMIGDGEDIFNQIDTLFRHDNNVMMLTTSPMFLADQTLKDQIDLGRAENVLRPGITYWVPNPDKNPIRQLMVQDIAASSGDNNAKMAILTRFAELVLGISQGESGNQTPDDPRAPAHKTQLLLLQANKRVDQCIDEWCLSFPDLAKLHATLLYQFSTGDDYKYSMPGKQNQSFPLKLLADPRLKWMPRRRSVTLTPEFALSRLASLFQTYSGLRPLMMQGDNVAIEIWNRTVRACGEPQAEKFVWDPQKTPQMMQQAMQMAMQQAQMQSTMKAHAKGQETLAKEAAKKVIEHLSEQAQMKASGGEVEEQNVAQQLQHQGA